ncbi:hypothetical protein HMPREF0880_00110 [Yokenella regensburgei ATCC 43003]|nr:hypothetical protein HMPREF0880_00110 [Yokenella regensburgei ATCC 43003]
MKFYNTAKFRDYDADSRIFTAFHSTIKFLELTSQRRFPFVWGMAQREK